MRDADMLEADRIAATGLCNSAERFASRKAYAAFRPVADPEHIRTVSSPRADVTASPAGVVAAAHRQTSAEDPYAP